MTWDLTVPSYWLPTKSTLCETEKSALKVNPLVVKIEKRRRHKDVINRQRLVMRDNHAQLLKNRDGSSTFTLVNDISN